jgi:hypothetical protein
MLASTHNIPFVSKTPPGPPSNVSSSKNFLGLIFRPDLLTSSCLRGDCVGALGVLEFADAPTTGGTNDSDDFTDDSLVLEADFRDDCTEPRFARFDSISC